jgi:uncharacterized protein (DUF1330 family)
MSVYLIFSFDVSDKPRFAPYGKAVTPLIVQHGGEVVVADFTGSVLEGTGHQANVVIRFSSEEAAMAFYHDPAYAPLKKLRTETTADSTVTLVKQFVAPA